MTKLIVVWFLVYQPIWDKPGDVRYGQKVSTLEECLDLKMKNERPWLAASCWQGQEAFKTSEAGEKK